MQIEPHEVNGLLYMVVKPVFTLKTASGREIRTTGNHPYLTMSGWKKVVDIKIGEEIASTLAPAGTLGASGSPTGTRSSAKGAAPSLQALTKPIPSAENAPIQLILGNLSSSNKTIFLETFSAGIWEKTKVKAACILSNFLTRIFIQIMPACLSGENVSGSVKSKSWVKSTLDSACASFATSPFSMPSGALFASWPSSLSHLISPTWTFSSKRNSILWGDRSGGGKDGVEFYGLNDFRGEMESSPNVIWAQRWISLQNFFGGSSVFQHLDNEVNHDSRSLETRLAVANIGINPDAIFPLLNIHGSIVTEELAIDQEANVLWDKIVSIEYSGREPVWDIEVEGTHNFIGNRIFAHNTYMSGNVGIGTTAPASKTHIFQAAGTGGSYLKVSSGAVDLLEVAGGSVTINAGTFYVKGAVDTAAGSGFNGWDTNASDDFAAGGILPGGATSYIQNAGATLQSGATFYISSGTVDEVLRVKGTNVSGTSPAFQVIGGTLTVLANGNVGIGTSGPGARLAVAGSLIASGSLKGGVNLSDLAENITASDLTIEAGDVVAADPGQIESIVKSRQPYEDRVLGVISTEPGMLINPQMSDFDVKAKYDPGQKPLVLAGRVPVKVTLENGPIAIGDRLTASSKPGYAMKATKSGRVVGIALEAFGDGGEAERQRGGAQEGKKPLTPTLSPLARGEGKMEEDKILAFINPHYWVNPDDYAALNDRVSRLETEIKLLKSETIIGKK